MLFRKKNILFFALSSLFFSFLLFGLFIKSENASALSYFSGNYSSRVNVYYYDASMPSTRGYSSLTPINNGPVPSSTPSNEGKLLSPTGANYYIYTVGLTLHGLSISGGDSSKRYQSAESDAYLYLPGGASVGDFDDSDLSCTYYTQSGNYVTMSGSWSYSLEVNPTAAYFVILDCPVVQNSNYDPYVSVDFDLGNFFQNNPQNPPSDYFYRYVNGGGVWFSGGSYQVSSSDNEELNAIENQTYIIENGFNNIYNTINDFNSEQQEAYDNISNQSPSDISDSTSSQTSSIIGVISSFISALSSVQTGSCELTLPFPNYAGGSQVVNPCSGKEKAPTIVQIGSSMLLIGTFIPLAFIVLKMIFNEIRSWTNG